VPQRVNWLEDADVLDKRLVPQVTHEESEQNNPNGYNDQVINCILTGSGIENRNHLSISQRKKLLIVRW
jgi:hypothetical protein